MEDTINLLVAARNTLNRVTVCGKDNLDMLLGCINALDTAITVLQRHPEAAAQQQEEIPAEECPDEEVNLDG